MRQAYLDNLNDQQVVDHIVALNRALAEFWSDDGGWAPTEVSQVLQGARLDWQVSLSECLRYWIADPAHHTLSDGQLILGWTNLGSLIEGTLKLFLTVYSHDYRASVDAVKEKSGRLKEPHTLTIEPLQQFCRKTEQWGKHGQPDWDPYIESVQLKRNAIHGFKSRDIGDTGQLLIAIRQYLAFAHDVAYRLPYPDDTRWFWMQW